MSKHLRLMKKNLFNLISFLYKDIPFVVLHILLQSIVRCKSNRGKLFYSKIFIRKFSFIRNFSKFRKIKIIRLSIKFSKKFPFLQSIIAPQVFKKGIPKMI